MQKFKSVDDMVNQLKPTEPVYCIRKKSIQLASKYFQKNFPGNLFWKYFDANCIDFFLIQYTGSTGFSRFTSSSTDLNFCI